MSFVPKLDFETGLPFCRRMKFCGNHAQYYSPVAGYGQLCAECAKEKQKKQRAASLRRRNANP